MPMAFKNLTTIHFIGIYIVCAMCGGGAARAPNEDIPPNLLTPFPPHSDF
jgi:hypothetical protein